MQNPRLRWCARYRPSGGGRPRRPASYPQSKATGAMGWYLGLLLVAVLAMGGCARTARDTRGFAVTESKTVNAPFDQTWQITKSVLREKDFELYTRDKRGVFVAYSGSRRSLVLVPHRTKYTISVESVSDSATQVTVEAVKQVYGVTLLTYPGWHDRKTTDNKELLALLQAIEAKVSGESPTTDNGTPPAPTADAKTS